MFFRRILNIKDYFPLSTPSVNTLEIHVRYSHQNPLWDTVSKSLLNCNILHVNLEFWTHTKIWLNFLEIQTVNTTFKECKMFYDNSHYHNLWKLTQVKIIVHKGAVPISWEVNYEVYGGLPSYSIVTLNHNSA